ncbi:MAG: hypothetical protein ABSH20_06105 [Tepidisphaeraceae bacterium]
MFRFNFQRVCLLVMTLCALAAAGRPVWVGWGMVREPGRIREMDVGVPPDGAPVSDSEMDRAQAVMLQVAGGDAPKEGFTKEKVESFARSMRKVSRAREAAIRERQAKELAYARSFVPRGRMLIGLGIVLAAGWLAVVSLFWRRVGPAAAGDP